jgi:hypothetical protein
MGPCENCAKDRGGGVTLSLLGNTSVEQNFRMISGNFASP